jgi:hypothetical protein
VKEVKEELSEIQRVVMVQFESVFGFTSRWRNQYITKKKKIKKKK